MKLLEALFADATCEACGHKAAFTRFIVDPDHVARQWSSGAREIRFALLCPACGHEGEVEGEREDS